MAPPQHEPEGAPAGPAVDDERRADGGSDEVVRRAPFSDNPRVGARGQRTQQRIVDAALRVFGEDGYHQCGVARITELATNEKDPKLRAEAIQKLGLMGSKSAPALRNFYATGDCEVKEAGINGLFVMGNAKALIGLAKKETNRQMKKEILQKLSVMGSDDAVAYMLELLEE